MLKPSDLTKAELLQVVEMLAMETGPYYLDRALGRIRLQRNDAHHERCVKLIDEERKHYAAYFDLLRPYEGKPIADVPPDVLEQAQAELGKARAAGQEWNRRSGIKLKGKVIDEKCTGENCPMQMGYDFENCAAIEKCPYRTWPVTIADRIRSMPDDELAGVLYNFRMDFITKDLSSVSTMPANWHEIKKWLETPWEGKP